MERNATHMQRLGVRIDLRGCLTNGGKGREIESEAPDVGGWNIFLYDVLRELQSVNLLVNKQIALKSPHTPVRIVPRNDNEVGMFRDNARCLEPDSAEGCPSDQDFG